MKPELKAKWVATLRSGNYSQGKSCLRDREDNCCCLGVLCDITEPSKWHRLDQALSWRHEANRFDFPTEALMKSWGLTGHQAHKLASLNDHGATFTEIADYIEKNV